MRLQHETNDLKLSKVQLKEFTDENEKRIKKCLLNIIPKEETVLEFATALLSFYISDNSQNDNEINTNINSSINPNKRNRNYNSQKNDDYKLIPFNEKGICTVTVNRKESNLYLQGYELKGFNKVFEIELYTNIQDGYNIVSPYFHKINFNDFILGISFVNLHNKESEINARSIQFAQTIKDYSAYVALNYEHFRFFNYHYIEKMRNVVKNTTTTVEYDKESNNNKTKARKKTKEEEKKLTDEINSLDEIARLINTDVLDVEEVNDNEVISIVEIHIGADQMKPKDERNYELFQKLKGTTKLYTENGKHIKYCQGDDKDKNSESNDSDMDSEQGDKEGADFSINYGNDMLQRLYQNDEKRENQKERDLINQRAKMKKGEVPKQEVLKVENVNSAIKSEDKSFFN